MNKVVMNFGRLNPPSIGHRKLARIMRETADSIDADAIMYLSSSYDGKFSPKPAKNKDENTQYKNPLSFESKLKYVNDTVSDLVQVSSTKAGTLYDALALVYRQGYKECYLFGGDDRADDFERAKTYNGKKDVPENKYFNFNTLEIISAGKRSEASDDIEEQASASLLRQCVKDLDYDRFEKYAGTESLT